MKNIILVSKEFHLKRASEFQEIIDKGLYTSNTDKLVYERLRDQRLKLANNL